MQWNPPYNLARDTISDLGNTACGTFNSRPVCSPLHALMNASFIALGIAMTAGSMLISRKLATSRAATAGFAAMAISGIGVIIVGIFPENSIPAFHGLGAAIPFTLGNAALIIIAAAPMMPAVLRLYSFLSGALALLALAGYSSGHYLGLGEGGIERIVAYPQTVWLIVIGLFTFSQGARIGHTAGGGAQRADAAPAGQSLGWGRPRSPRQARWTCRPSSAAGAGSPTGFPPGRLTTRPGWPGPRPCRARSPW